MTSHTVNHNKYYTLVGSRETPDYSYDCLTAMAWQLANKGWIGRSGGADGADTALEDGVTWIGKGIIRDIEVYLPWEGFNGRSSSDKGYINASKLKNFPQAMSIAEQTHPAWDKCSRGARALHSRNVYQVLGMDLNTPSTFLLCWAIPTKTGVKGGTNTAVQLAKKHGAEVINIYGMSFEEALESISKYIDKE